MRLPVKSGQIFCRHFKGENCMSNIKNRGFASMSPEKRREIASKGGRKAHEMGTAHTFTTQEAIKAGTKGGKTSGASRSKKAKV